MVLAGRHVQVTIRLSAHSSSRLTIAYTALPTLQESTSLPARLTNPWPGHLHFAAVVADLAMCPAPADNLDGPHGGDVGPMHTVVASKVHHLGQGLDPGQKTKPIHAEMDCVHRVPPAAAYASPCGIAYGQPFGPPPTTDIISHGAVRAFWVCSTAEPNGSRRATPTSTFQHRPGHRSPWPKVLSMGLVVRMCFQCSAGKS